jgi:hypothetical protein
MTRDRLYTLACALGLVALIVNELALRALLSGS